MYGSCLHCNLLYENCTYNFTVLFSLLQKDENMMPGFWQTLACEWIFKGMPSPQLASPCVSMETQRIH